MHSKHNYLLEDNVFTLHEQLQRGQTKHYSWELNVFILFYKVSILCIERPKKAVEEEMGIKIGRKVELG